MSAHDRDAAAGGEAAVPPPGGVWEAAVVGAGPAGSLAALLLARCGRRVLLLDKQGFPREKVCGDTLIEDALRSLERAGLLAAVAARAYTPTCCAIHSPGGVEVRLPGRFLTIRRVVLDEILRAQAVAAGATFAVASVSGVAREGASFRVAATSGAVHARCVLLATGASPALPRRCGFTVPERDGVAAAIRCYARSSVALDRLVVSFDRAIAPGYAWLFPLGGGEFNVGCGVAHDAVGGEAPDLHAALARFLGACREARELTAGASAMTRPRGGMLRTGLAGAEPVSADGVLAIGEAIGTTLAFTGEGIGKAMESAELAAEAADRFLASGRRADLLGYRDSVTTRLGPTIRAFEKAQRWLRRPGVLDLVCRRGVTSAGYARLLAEVLAEKVPAGRALSLAGLARSLFA